MLEMPHCMQKIHHPRTQVPNATWFLPWSPCRLIKPHSSDLIKSNVILKFPTSLGSTSSPPNSALEALPLLS